MKIAICTSPNQSKHLLDIGFDPEYADMYYPMMPDGQLNQFPLSGYKMELAEKDDIPAWSLTKLIQIMPETIYGPVPKDHPTKLIIRKNGVYYFDETGLQHGPCFVSSEDRLIDAVYKMICWLAKNGYIKGYIK